MSILFFFILVLGLEPNQLWLKFLSPVLQIESNDFLCSLLVFQKNRNVDLKKIFTCAVRSCLDEPVFFNVWIAYYNQM